MTSEILFTAIALALIIEGIIPALFPNKWRAYVLKLANSDDDWEDINIGNDDQEKTEQK